MDSSLAPTNVAPFLGRWRVHGLHGAVTPALEQEVGIGDEFDVMPVEGTERHALAMPLGSTACHTVTGPATRAARAASAAAALATHPAPAFYLCGSDERRTTLSVGLKTHEERRKPPSYICDRLAYSVLDGAESGGGGAGAAAPRPAAIMWRCSRQGETHIVEWRAVDAPVGRHRVLPPKLSDSVRLAIGAARQAPRTAQCQCGVFPACPHADAVTGVSGVVWVDSDLRTTAIKLEGEKPSRQFDYCVRRAHAAAARRLLGSTSTKSRVSLSVAVHLPAPVHNIASRNYTGIGPFSQAWMDQHVLADERRFFDRVDFRGMKSADQQPALWIPNLDRRDWVVGGATTPAAAKKALAFAADVDTRARKRAAAELTTAIDRLSPHQLELFANAGTPPVKLPLFDEEDQLRAQVRRQATLIKELQKQAAEREELLRGTEERCADAERVVLFLTNGERGRQRRWFQETTLHRNKTMSLKYSVQAHFFGIGGTYKGMCALLKLLFEVEESHSADDVKAKLTPFEACLVAKSYLFRRTPIHALCVHVRK